MESRAGNDLKDLHPSYPSDIPSQRPWHPAEGLIRGFWPAEWLDAFPSPRYPLVLHCAQLRELLRGTLAGDQAAKPLKWVLCVHLKTSPTAPAGSLVIPVLRGD